MALPNLDMNFVTLDRLPAESLNNLVENIEALSDGSGLTAGSANLKTVIGNIMYPVGSLYYNATVSTNPATLLGFGTWVAFGEGRVIVGKNSTGTFNTLGATGGVEAHTLTTAELAVHSHGVYDPGHSHSFTQDPVNTAGDGNSRAYNGGGGQQFAWSRMGLSTNGSNVSLYNTGSGTAHNNLQPYIVVYCWWRSA